MSVEVSRRGLVRGIGALAALAVTPKLFTPLGTTDVERFLALARTGFVSHQTFLLDGGIVLDGFHNLFVSNCVFQARQPFEGALLTLGNCENLTFVNILFDNTGLLLTLNDPRSTHFPNN